MDIVVTVPDGTKLDGAVVELSVELGWIAADVRIPAPED